MIQTNAEMHVLMVLMQYPEILLLLLFLSMLLAVELGRLYGWRRGERLKADTPGASSLNGAIFALLGLFMAFSFSGAASRFDTRRQLMINEINAASTVSARIALAPAAVQPQLHATLKSYVRARIESDRPSTNVSKVFAGVRKANDIGADLWNQAVAAGKRPGAGSGINGLLLPSINTMNETAATLAYSSLMHPPPIIHYMLIILAWTAAFLAGIGLSTHSRRTWIHAVNFAAIISAVLFITIDLEYPRAGFIRTDGFESSIGALSGLL